MHAINVRDRDMEAIPLQTGRRIVHETNRKGNINSATCTTFKNHLASHPVYPNWVQIRAGITGQQKTKGPQRVGERCRQKGLSDRPVLCSSETLLEFSSTPLSGVPEEFQKSFRRAPRGDDARMSQDDRPA